MANDWLTLTDTITCHSAVVCQPQTVTAQECDSEVLESHPPVTTMSCWSTAIALTMTMKPTHTMRLLSAAQWPTPLLTDYLICNLLLTHTTTESSSTVRLVYILPYFQHKYCEQHKYYEYKVNTDNLTTNKQYNSTEVVFKMLKCISLLPGH